MLTIILCWFFLLISFIFIGKLVIKGAEWYEYFWLGFAITTASLQIWSIFSPVNILVLTLFFIVSILSFLLYKNQIRIRLTSRFLLIALVLIVLLAYFASLPVGWDDTLLYHLNAVKWAKTFPVVPGLGNLHSRLGFNSSLFLIAAMFDNLLIKDRSSHLVLFTMSSVLVLQILWILTGAYNKKIKLFCLFLVPLLFSEIAHKAVTSSLSPDFAGLIIVIVISIQLLIKRNPYITLILSLTLITIKPTTIIFSLLVIFYLTLKSLTYTNLIRQKYFYILSFLTLFLLLPFIIRNYYLTGWLLYPLPFFHISTEWTVPSEQVRNLYQVISTWARVPGSEWSKFVDAPFLVWFPVWFDQNKYKTETILFGFSIIILMSNYLLDKYKKHGNQDKTFLYLIIISFVSIFYIFISAPDYRYFSVYIWLLFSAVLTMFLSRFILQKNSLKYLMFAILIFSVFISWPFKLKGKIYLRSIRWEKPWPTVEVNGILRPTDEDLCGNSELPCSPEENKIRFRQKDDLSKGFAPIY